MSSSHVRVRLSGMIEVDLGDDDRFDYVVDERTPLYDGMRYRGQTSPGQTLHVDRLGAHVPTQKTAVSATGYLTDSAYRTQIEIPWRALPANVLAVLARATEKYLADISGGALSRDNLGSEQHE